MAAISNPAAPVDGLQSRAGRILREHWPLLLILAITAAAYSSVLTFGFVYDDDLQIVENPRLTSWGYLGSYFTTHVWSQNRVMPASYYRPVFLLWLRLQYALFGLNTAGWHLATLGLHLLATALVFFVAVELSRSRSAGSVSALVFGLHPIHVESVAWVSGCTDSLLAIFLLGAYLLFLRNETRPHLATGMGGLLCFACAAFSKETAVVFPAILVVHALWKIRSTSSSNRRRHFTWPAMYALVAAGFLIVRELVMRAYPPAFHHTLNGIRIVLLSVPRVLWFYVGHLLAPHDLSESYPLKAVREFSFSHVVLPALFLLALGIAVWWMLRRFGGGNTERVSLDGTAWIIFPLLPVLDLIVMPPADYVHDRYLYIPSIGLCLLAGAFIADVVQRFSPRRALLLSLAFVSAMSLAIACHAEARVWRDDETFFRRVLAVYPSYTPFRNNLGAYLIDHGRIPEAIAQLELAIFYNPNHRSAHVNLGICYEKLGDLKKAEYHWQRAQEIGPDPEIAANLARIRGQIASQK